MKITTPRTLYSKVPIGLAVPFGRCPANSSAIKCGSGTVDMKKTNRKTQSRKIPAVRPTVRLPNRKSRGMSSFFHRNMMYAISRNKTGNKEVAAVILIKVSRKLSKLPIPSAGTIINSVTTTPWTINALVGLPSSLVLTNHLPRTPSGISEKKTLTGAAV